uniref:Uncharacterized protein n=1 Tax=Cannabis sativa TaxID=3483 RepID=A0A803QRN7_CANSA
VASLEFGFVVFRSTRRGSGFMGAEISQVVVVLICGGHEIYTKTLEEQWLLERRKNYVDREFIPKDFTWLDPSIGVASSDCIRSIGTWNLLRLLSGVVLKAVNDSSWTFSVTFSFLNDAFYLSTG